MDTSRNVEETAKPFGQPALCELSASAVSTTGGPQD